MTRNAPRHPAARRRLLLVAGPPTAPAPRASRSAARASGTASGMSQYGAMGVAVAGLGLPDDPRALLHGHRARHAATAPREVRVLLQSQARQRRVLGRQRAAAAASCRPPAPTTRAAAAGGLVAAAVVARTRAGHGRAAAARDRPRLARPARPRRQRPQRTAPTAARSSSGPARSAASTPSTPSGSTTTSQGVVPVESPASWPIEALKAQAVAARTYAVTTGKGGRRLGPVPRHALAGLRRRRRRDGRDQRGDAGHAARSSSPTRARRWSRSSSPPRAGGPRTSRTRRSATTPQALAAVRRRSVRQRLAEAPLGADPDDLRGRRARGCGGLVKGRFRGIEVDQRGVLAAHRRRRHRRLARAHARDGRDAARPLRALRHVGLLHLDPLRPAPAPRRPAAARERHDGRRRPRGRGAGARTAPPPPGCAATCCPARRGARLDGAAARGRPLDRGGARADRRRRPLPRARGGARASTACAGRGQRRARACASG